MSILSRFMANLTTKAAPDFKSPQAYDFRSARESDLDFIMAEILEEAKHGHFHKEFLTQGGAYALRLNLEEIIEKGISRTPLDLDYGPEEARNARLLVYRCMASEEQVGFLLLSEQDPTTSVTNLDEFYMGGIREGYREKGHGSRMIELMVARLSEGRKLHARCYPASHIMCLILQKASFRIIKTKRSGVKELEFTNS